MAIDRGDARAPAGWGGAQTAVRWLAVLALAPMLLSFGLIAPLLLRGEVAPLLSHQLVVPLIVVSYTWLGGVIALRQPRNPIGWLFMATGVLSALTLLANAGVVSATALELTAWLGGWLYVPALFLPTLFVFLYFPDGRLPGRRWRPLSWLAGVGVGAVTLGLALHPGPLELWGVSANRFGLSGMEAFLGGFIDAGTALLLIGLAATFASLVVRYRSSRGARRQQMKWLIYAAGIVLLGFVLGGLGGLLWPDDAQMNEVGIALSSLMQLSVPIAAAVAISRHRLYDIDTIIGRTLVYGGLTAVVAAIYIVCVGALSTLFRAQDNLLIALLATGLVAALFQPLRARLQRAVNRLVYGERDDPGAVLARLGRRLEATLDANEVFPTLAETVAQALRLPYAAVGLRREEGLELVAEVGRPRGGAVRLPLRYQDDRFGELIVEPRERDTPFEEGERRLLDTVARQASAAAYAARLDQDLRRSRERLVSAREEERRRLRRDLHDGLGPRLASQALKLEAARELLSVDPDRAEALLSGVLDQSRDALDEVRRLVYALRPPALDELGLLAALREYLTQDLPYGLRFELTAPADLPPLPAAVEVAAYRIVQEGVTNVIRHAGASLCRVRLTLEAGALLLEVHDDGRGLSPDRPAGVGLGAMRERAEELGGSFHLDRPVGGGARLRARLPLQAGEG